MVLVVVRHAQSIENATKYTGFYRARRPYGAAVAHEISRDVVGLTPTGFRQCEWLASELASLAGPRLQVFTSTYRRAIDTAEVAFGQLPDGQVERTALLDEQHYGAATYMTKEELFATFPETAADRRERKHLWTPPGGGESLAGEVSQRARDFLARAATELEADHDVVAMTHHTTILALRALLEDRPLTDVVEQARSAKTPSAAVFRYEPVSAGRFTAAGQSAPTA
jgi:broad specificity phosphatase PhoE